jgi:hypothetical protein
MGYGNYSMEIGGIPVEQTQGEIGIIRAIFLWADQPWLAYLKPGEIFGWPLKEEWRNIQREIDFIENDMGDHVYHVWADPANSGIEPANQYFSVETMRDAVRKSLLYMVKNFPEKTTALSSALIEYKLR